LRNFLLNQLMLFPATMGVLLLVRLILLFFGWNGTTPWDQRLGAAADGVTLWDEVFGILMIVALGVALFFIYRSIKEVTGVRETASGSARHPQRTLLDLHRLILVPLLTGAIIFCWLFVFEESATTKWQWLAVLVRSVVGAGPSQWLVG